MSIEALFDKLRTNLFSTANFKDLKIGSRYSKIVVYTTRTPGEECEIYYNCHITSIEHWFEITSIEFSCDSIYFCLISVNQNTNTSKIYLTLDSYVRLIK